MAYVLRIKKSSFPNNTEISYSTYIELITKRCTEEKLRVVQEEKNDIALLRIDAPNREVLEVQAEKQGFYKAIKQGNEVKEGRLDQFVRSKSKSYVNYTAEEDEFWHPCETLDLLHGVLNDMVLGEDLHFVKEICVTTLTAKTMDVNDSLLHAGIEAGILSDIVPLHESKERTRLFKETLWKSPFTNLFIEQVYQYYGSKVALYFAWMNHFTLWLCAPGCLGGCVWFHNYLDDGVSIDNSRLAPYYTIFVICWAVLFVQFWKRKCAVLTCGWGTIGEMEQSDSTRIRPRFHGVVRISPVTGGEEKFYPYKKRLFKYMQSLVVTSGMLCIAFMVMVLSLNFQGYIHTNSFGAYWLHFPIIQQFSAPGKIFDPNSTTGYWTLIPTIVHAFTITKLNTKYRSIAVALTEAENHKTEDQFENALIIKRFLFEAFDSYIALFFLAFIQCDIVLLRAELVALFTADSVRRIITECILPFFVQLKNRRDRTSSAAQSKKSDDDNNENGNTDSALVDELEQDEYEQFDDYLEMVIQFGYVTLFATAFPLSGLLSIFCNFIEIKSDLFKLTYVVRRPSAIRTASIGTWLSILQGLVWLSIMTNIFIFAFTTEQMMQVFPSLFVISTSDDVDFGGSDHMHTAAEGKGMWVVGIAVILERVLFLVAMLVYAAIPDLPTSVSEEMKRREYAHALMIAEKRGQE